MSDIVLERATITTRPPSELAKRLRKWALLASAVALLGLAGARYGENWWHVGRFIETTDDAYVGGNVTAISPHVAGFVAQILVQDNQYVRAGDLLARLDDRDLRAAVDHAEAILEQRKAALAGLRAKYALQRSLIDQAAADIDARSAQAQFAREEAERYRALVLTSAGSKQDAQRTFALDHQARAALASAEAALAAARQQLAVLDTQIAEAAAAVAQAEADLRTARLNLSYTEIRAPVDGYVGNRAAQLGAYVAEGAYLLTIVPAQGLWIDANFKEDQLARMRPGQPVTIIADALPGHELRGHVLSVAPGTGAIFSVIPPENATGNFTKIVQRVPVRIALDDTDATLGGIRPGLSITASVDTR
jgi:membrane fusion protein (multidrug efflux system)